jgi:formylglycine-generating enzyme required for sulfatase activity
MIASDVTLYAVWTLGPYAQDTFTAAGINFTMSHVPGGYTFPTGADDNGDINADGIQDVSPTATVTNAYWIAETEVTYELWYVVYDWAVNGTDGATGEGQYTFGLPGREGNDGTDGAVPTATAQEPVTNINWRDSMVWSNALTEWYNAQNGTSYSCAYYTDAGYTTPIRTSTDATTIDYPNPGSEDDPYVNASATGFRLLTSDEWELAARWRDDSTNTVTGYSNPWVTTGNSASGAWTYYNDESDTDSNGVVDNRDTNDELAVYRDYYDGGWQSTGVTGTAEVKSKASNSLGLYDMSGNVWEWCFDWYPGSEGSYRVPRGGGWYYGSNILQIGYVYDDYPYTEINYIGFRFSRTAD